MTIDDVKFVPSQFHFHSGIGETDSPTDDGSENTFNGKHFPLEMHVVHMNEKYTQDGQFRAAVLGVMFDLNSSPDFKGSFADSFF